TKIRNSKTVGSTLKKLCPTRWLSRVESIISLKSNYLVIVKCLSNLAIIAKKKSDSDEAKVLQNKILNLYFYYHFKEKYLKTSIYLENVCKKVNCICVRSIREF
ncbi:unnamed protein product, partial [Callosobruchus maculatus]